jgi:Helix-turn-helix domain
VIDVPFDSNDLSCLGTITPVIARAHTGVGAWRSIRQSQRRRTMIDLTADLTAWLGTPEVRALLKSIVAEAVRDEVRTALEDELLDVERAAQMLGMSAGALRKAVERGQVPCERIGNRLRFRRMDLLTSGASARRVANVNATASPRRAVLPPTRVRRQLAAPTRTHDEPGEHRNAS